MSNKRMILINGESANGKTASLEYLDNHEGVLYLNCEAGKDISFKHNFVEYKITNPVQVYQAFDKVLKDGTVKNPKTGEQVPIHTIVIDSITFLMDMFVSQHVNTSPDTRRAWGEYGEFVRVLMQDKIANSPCTVIVTAHTLKEDNMETLSTSSRAALQGGLGKGTGLEAYFSTVVYAKRIRLKELEPFLDKGPSMLTVTEDEEFDGNKYVYVTRPFGSHSGDRIRSPRGMFKPADALMDNNAQLLINTLNNFYEN